MCHYIVSSRKKIDPILILKTIFYLNFASRYCHRANRALDKRECLLIIRDNVLLILHKSICCAPHLTRLEISR